MKKKFKPSTAASKGVLVDSKALSISCDITFWVLSGQLI